MFGFLKNIFDENKKALDSYTEVVAQIDSHEPALKKLSDAKLAAQTKKFKKIIAEKRAQGIDDQDILTELLPEAFATVRETARRLMGMRHFDVQLIAGIALHHGTITEQKTGEGKTLTVTAPLYLNALLGHGAHLVTVNDYLAELGAGWMAPIYNFLGLSTSVIVHDKSSIVDPEHESEERGDERLEHFRPVSRREAYEADITYGTNNEFGFDYLRDNMVQNLESMAQRPNHTHHYAIVDEADSILIDEARTPLIISAPDSDPTDKYFTYAKMITTLERKADYTVDEKSRSVTLTDLGVKRIEQKLGVANLYEESFDTIHHVESALKAKTIFTRDKDYIVRDNQVIIVDDHTGRLMYGRRYSDGLHQAIEAKENVPIQQESRTLATVSIQNYFRQYEKLSGMTGTAETEKEEFETIYKTRVLVVPTHRQIQRTDKADTIYKTTAAKYSAIAAEVARIHQTGQPVLVGTRSIEHNEMIADFLKRKKVPHQVLNAKNHEKEAFIIADAGKKGAITVATNIAGRGVDIVLGGAKPELKDYRKKTAKAGATPTAAQTTLAKELHLPGSVNPVNYKLSEYQKALETWRANHDEVLSLGGLAIIGTERHESRRIDNQLRGRAGRQGDPGMSQFFIALDDEIMRIFGGDQIAKVMDFLQIEEDQPIEHGMVGKAIESAQVKVEGFFFDQRKRVVEFDDVMNKQREIIYKRRRRLLEQAGSTATQTEDQEGQTLKEEVLGYVEADIAYLAIAFAPQEFTKEEYAALIKEFCSIIPFDTASQHQLVTEISELTTSQAIAEKLTDIATKAYNDKEKNLGEAQMRMLERLVTLSTIDEKWMDHLDAMEALREGIWLRGDKRTVLAEYKKEAFTLFEELIGTIEATVAKRIYRAHVQQVQGREMPQNIQLHKDDINESLAKEIADATLPTPAAAPTNRAGSMSDLAAALKTAQAKPSAKPGVSKAKIKRNDPCPCGSGLKYKKCGLVNAPEHTN